MTKVAIVTGGGKGLGFCLCKLLLSEGYSVCALEKFPTENLLNLERETEELSVFEADITDGEKMALCRKSVEEKYGRVDLIINNAAVWMDKHRREIEDEKFEMDMCLTEFNINTMGPLRVIREFLPLLRKGQSDCRAIVNLSSDCASYNPETNPRAGEYAYCISKAGVNIISNLVANNLAETDIKVFAVFPGWMQTDMGFAGVSDENNVPGVSPAEAASCILSLVKGPKLPYTYCDRFGKQLS